MADDQYISVSQFNRMMKKHFDSNPSFRNVYVKGEVSDVYTSPIGHFYFTLKDKSSVIKCIIYNRFLKDIGFKIKEGMKLLVIANVTVYPPHGKYQLDVRSATEDGLGKLYVKMQQLKEKLSKEGLFDKEHKKPLSRFPKTIGVVTSKGGSVIHDIIETVNQNWPYCQILLFPSAVQGPAATTELVKQIRIADSYNLDVLIVARGGGSLEDIWSFNEESVVRTIFNVKTPVISAIGHEDDVTLTDMVSDKRASTPTMAASLAIEDKDVVKKDVDQLNSRLLSLMSSKIKDYRKELDFILSKSLFTDSNYVYASEKAAFINISSRFGNASSEILNNNRHMLENIKSAYVIRYPCKMQVDRSRSNLNELKNRLIDSMDLILKSNQSNLDKASNKFDFYSQNLLTSKKHELEMMERFFISNPCQSQIESSKSGLKVSHDKIINNINFRLNSNKKDFELLLSNFGNVSHELILKKSHKLDSIKNREIIRNPKKLYHSKRQDIEMMERFFISNPCQSQIESSRNSLKVSQEKVINNMNVRLKSNKKDFELLLNNFENESNGLILRESHKLDSIKNREIIRNPKKLYQSKKSELNSVKDERILKDPYLILDESKSEFKMNKEKLDKISQVIDLKKEQERQKSMYVKVIIAIVIFMIIIIILMFGGILNG